MRKLTPLNQNWILLKEGKEEIVSLPHCFNANDGQGEKESMYQGVVTYKKSFVIDEIQPSTYLEVGAASLSSTVKLNGVIVGKSNIGFALSRYDLKGALKVGVNELQILVSNAPNKNIYPTMADFSFYGGLYRDVNLIEEGPTHFEELDHSRDGIRLLPSIANKTGKLLVKADVASSINEEVKIRVEIAGAVKESELSKIEAKGELSVILDIPNVHRWNGIADPYLYEVKVSLLNSKEKALDERDFKTGFRDIYFDEERGLLLNGKPYQLRGVARHQDYGGLGNAIGITEMKIDLQAILEIGANAVRLSHYQHDDKFYSLCDEAGLLVYAEIPVISAVVKSKEVDENAFDHLESLIKQTSNHCSIFAYGVQNEVCMVTKNEYTFSLVSALAKKAKELDPTRMVAQANEYTTEDDCKILDATDILGFNLYYGWYYGKKEDLGPRLDSIMAAHPEKMVLLTEYGVDANPALHSLPPVANDYSEEYQLLFSHNALKTFEARPTLGGSFVWTMFDFGSASREEGGKKGQNQKGLITIDRKIKKDAFYLYKAYWSKEKFVYIAGRRFANRADLETSIEVISNLSTVSLYVNGRLLERQYNEDKLFTFEGVKLRRGKNVVEAKSEGYSDSICLNRVLAPDQRYVLPKKKEEARSSAKNWFENVDVETLLSLDKPLRKEGFTLEDTVAEIGENPAAKKVFLKYFEELTKSSRFSFEAPIPVSKLLMFARVELPEKVKKAINAELNQIDK